MAMDEVTRREVERQTERWFVRQGIPHFIDGYSATSDVFTRAAGFLYLVFIVQILNGLNLDWPWWTNALALAGSAGIMLGGVALLNRARGRPWYRRPDRIGPIELTAFVVLPAVLPAVFGVQLTSALVTLVANLVLLGVIYVAVSYGVIPMTLWAVRQTFRQLGDLLNVMLRTLPLLLLFTMFMFLNAELWDVVDEIPGELFVVSVAMLVVLGSVLLLAQLPRELGEVGHFDRWARVADLTDGTPVESVDLDGLDEPPDPPPLNRPARVNVGLLLYFGQSTQVLLVAFAIGAFYFLFGLVTVSTSTIELWTARDELDVVSTWSFLGHDLSITPNLIRASIFVSAIAGLQFVVSALRDPDYREEFAEDAVRELRRMFAVRTVYLAEVAGGRAQPSSPAAPTDTDT